MCATRWVLDGFSAAVVDACSHHLQAIYAQRLADSVDRLERLLDYFYIEELVVVANFGEPIFPTLVPMARVQNGSDDAPWHTLIEADNYHALQLLEYLYTGR